MIRTLVACVRAWLRSWCALWRVAWRGPQPSRYSAAGPWSPPAPSYDPLDNVPAAVGQQEEQPMATKPKRKPTKPAAPRVWLHVVPRGTGTSREWAVIQRASRTGGGGKVLTVEETKKAALAVARTTGRHLWADAHQPVQVVIHAADGVIRADATYGLDPKRSRG